MTIERQHSRQWAISARELASRVAITSSRILGAAVQARLQLSHGRRQHENGDDIGGHLLLQWCAPCQSMSKSISRPSGHHAFPPARAACRRNCRGPPPIRATGQITKPLEPLNETEMIVHAGDLARPPLPRRDADRKDRPAWVGVRTACVRSSICPAPDGEEMASIGSSAGNRNGCGCRRLHGLLQILDLFAELVDDHFQFRCRRR